KKRDAFYFINEALKLTELTFVQAADRYKAASVEEHFSIHDKHHEQVIVAMHDFHEKMHLEAAQQVAIDSKQGPREKSVLAFLSAIEKLNFLSKTEQHRITLAKNAIKKGRFAD